MNWFFSDSITKECSIKLVKLSPDLINSTSSEQQPSKSTAFGVPNNTNHNSSLPLKLSTLKRKNAIKTTKASPNAVEVQNKSNQPKPHLSKSDLLKRKRIVPSIVPPENKTIKHVSNEGTTVIRTVCKDGNNMIIKKRLEIKKDLPTQPSKGPSFKFPFKVPVENPCPVNNFCDSKDETESILSLAITESSRRWVYFSRLF